jgi:hypothetical protein
VVERGRGKSLELGSPATSKLRDHVQHARTCRSDTADRHVQAAVLLHALAAAHPGGGPNAL